MNNVQSTDNMLSVAMFQSSKSQPTAASISGLLLTTDAGVSEIKEKKKAAPARRRMRAISDR